MPKSGKPNPEEQEINQAINIIHQLLDFASLRMLKEMLWNWLRIAVSSNYHRQTPHRKEEVVMIYEKIQELLDAAVLIYRQRNKLMYKVKKKKK
jgi:hypothetical protein